MKVGCRFIAFAATELDRCSLDFELNLLCEPEIVCGPTSVI